jgi:hypothetical protein
MQVSLKSEKNNGYFTWRRLHIYDISLNENEKCFRCKLYFKWPFFENRAVYEIMSKHEVELERPQVTLWHMRVACWISKTTCAQAHAPAYPHPHRHTHPSICASVHTHQQSCTHTHSPISHSYCFSTATIFSWTPRSVTLYVHYLSCYDPLCVKLQAPNTNDS